MNKPTEMILTTRNEHTGKAILRSMPDYAEYDPIEKLAYYEEMEQQGRLLVLPDDGMIYHIEENENNRWIGNKPIQDIIFKSGWGFVGLEYHLWDLGKKFFFSREEAEAALRGD